MRCTEQESGNVVLLPLVFFTRKVCSLHVVKCSNVLKAYVVNLCIRVPQTEYNKKQHV